MNRFALVLAKGQIVGSMERDDDDLSRSSNESSKKNHHNEDRDLGSISINGQRNHVYLRSGNACYHLVQNVCIPGCYPKI